MKKFPFSIGSTNNRVPKAPRVGTEAAGMLGGGACAVLFHRTPLPWSTQLLVEPLPVQPLTGIIAICYIFYNILQ